MIFSNQEDRLVKNYITTLQKENQARNKQRILLSEQIDRLELENIELKKRLSESIQATNFNSLQTSYNNLSKEVEYLRKKILQSQNQIIFYREQYETVRTQSIFIHEKMETVIKESFWYKQQYQTVIKQIIYVKEQQEAVVKQNQSLLTSIQENKNISELQYLKADRNQKTKQINRLNSLINSLQNQKSFQIRQIQRNHNLLISKLKNQFQFEKSQIKNQDNIKIKELEQKKQMVTYFQAQRQRQIYQQKIREQQYKLQESERLIKNNERQKQILLKKIHELESNNKQMQEKNVAAKNENLVKSLKDQIRKIQISLQNKEEDVKSLKIKQKQQQEYIQKIIQQKSNNFDHKLKQKESKILLLQKQIDTLQKALFQFKQHRQTMEKALRNRTQQLNYLQKKISEQNNIEFYLREIKDLKVYSSSLLQEKTNLTVQNLKLTEKLKQIDINNSKTSKYKQQYFKQEELHKERLQQLTMQNIDLKKEILALQSKLQNNNDFKWRNSQKNINVQKQAIHDLINQVRELKKNQTIISNKCKCVSCQKQMMHSTSTCNFQRRQIPRNHIQSNVFNPKQYNIYKNTQKFQSYLKDKCLMKGPFSQNSLQNSKYFDLMQKIETLKSQNQELQTVLDQIPYR